MFGVYDYGTNSLGWEVATGCNRCPEVVALASMRMKLFASFLHLHTPLVPKTIDIFFGIMGLDTLSPCSLEPPALGSGYTVYVLSMARCPLVSGDFFFKQRILAGSLPQIVSFQRRPGQTNLSPRFR